MNTESLILAIENLDPERKDRVFALLREAGFTARAFPECCEESSHVVRAIAAETALQESEERFATAFDSFPLPVAITDPETGIILNINRAVESTFGFTRGQVLGRSEVELDLITPETRKELGLIMLRDGRISGVSVTMRAAGGRVVEALYFVEPIRIEGRRRLLSAVLDLSELRRKEQALKEADRAIRILTDNLKEAVMAYDMDRRLLYVNPAIEALTGYTVEELKREQFICWVHADDRARMLGYWDRLFQGASYQNVEYRMVTKQGETKWVEASWGPLRDEEGRQVGVQGTERDVSARKRAEFERAELASRLLQVQKLETVGRLAGGVAHDFNNLLTVINGYTMLALDRLPEGDPLRAPLEEVLRAGDRAIGLVRQLLAFGRGQVLHPEPLEVADVLAGLEGTLRGLVGERVSVAVDLPPSLAPIYADRRQVEQVVMNLAANGRDAMPDGGTLTIRARNHPLATTCPYCGAVLRPHDFVALEVRDTGTGMDESTRRHLFEPFFTTKDVGKGTGLGLPTVHGIATQSGGHVCAESQPGRGSVFHVFLPAAGRHR